MRNTLASVPVPRTLPDLPYGYDALEPYIDAETMEVHHRKHHQAYIEKLDQVISRYPDLKTYDAVELLQALEQLDVDEADRTKIRNNAGGHANHSFFWTIMAPNKAVDKELASQIAETFGSVDDFKQQFGEAGAEHFGSGWVWLVRDQAGKLLLYSTANQDSPWMHRHQPVIGLDLWEHAYYLKYQNRRPEYIGKWWNVLKLI